MRKCRHDQVADGLTISCSITPGDWLSEHVICEGCVTNSDCLGKTCCSLQLHVLNPPQLTQVCIK